MNKVKERVQRIVWALQVAGIRNAVEILPTMPDLQEMLEAYTTQYEVDHATPTLSLFVSSTSATMIKVQLLADGTITCNCKQHLKDKSFSCVHIGEFCLHRGIDVPGGWFSTVRRLDPSFIVGPRGQAPETTRKNRAYRNMPQRVRHLAYVLCKDIPNPSTWPRTRRARSSNAGAKPIPLRVLLYCLILKVAFSHTYYGVRQETNTRDENIVNLGWTRGAPNWNTLCEALGDPYLRPYLERVIERTARMGRLLDFALLVDGSGFGTTMLRNWRGSKYSGKNVQRKTSSRAMEFDGDKENDAEAGVATEKLRDVFDLKNSGAKLLKKFRGFIKVHTAAGAISGLIYSVAITLNFGAGAGDASHLRWLVNQAMRLGRFDAVIADKAYGTERNFAFAAGLKILLFVLPRRGVTLQDAGIPAKKLFELMNAFRDQFPHVYRRFYRLRSKIETFFSSQKRTNGHIRSKIRNGDIDRMYGLRHDPYKLAKSAPEAAHELRAEICRMLAVSRVGSAHANEALLKGVAMNLRTLCRLEAKYGAFDLEMDVPVAPVPRVTLPRSA